MTNPSPTNKMRNAVALAYQANGKAPKVVATGKGLIAEQIIELAKENGVFVHESKEMVALLMKIHLTLRYLVSSDKKKRLFQSE